MADPVDLAGMIGTWVAAFLAIVALLGIVGPVLVWRASRTSRQQALTNIDSGQADSGGFVSRGIQFWPGIRLFRHVKAPMLQQEPLPGNFSMKVDHVSRVSKDSASWVKFGLAMRCIGLHYEVGNSLTIDDYQTLLPVNKTWIIIFGLLGRFGNRKDDGKLPRARQAGVISTQAVPGAALDNARPSQPRSRAGIRSGRATPFWPSTPYNGGAMHSIGEISYRKFGGVFGTLFMPASWSLRQQPHPTMHFDTHTEDETGCLEPDRIPIKWLFWLAMGCIPSPDGRVFCLENVYFVAGAPPEDGYGPENGSDDSDRMNVAPPPPPTPAQPVQWNIQNDDGSDVPPPPGVMPRGSPFIFDSPQELPLAPALAYSHFLGVAAFKFSPTEARSESFADVARALGAGNSNELVLSLEEMPLTHDERSELDLYGLTTYPPSDYIWTRLTPSNNARAPGSSWFLRRSDAQLLARALLKLPICDKGYLLLKSTRSLCREFLSSAANILPHLLVNIIFYFEEIEIPSSATSNLFSALKKLNAHLQNFEYSRGFMTAISELDAVLANVVSPDDRITDGIGVLVLCHEEFRGLITLAVRRMAQSIGGTIQIELENPSIVMKTVFGADQRFPVDMQVMFSGFRAERQSIDVSFSMFIMVVLKAAVRSAFLRTSLNSLPLLQKILKMDDIVYMG